DHGAEPCEQHEDHESEADEHEPRPDLEVVEPERRAGHQREQPDRPEDRPARAVRHVVMRVIVRVRVSGRGRASHKRSFYCDCYCDCGAVKNVYASESVSISAGKSGVTMNATLSSRLSCGSKACCVKQKHSVLRKWRAAVPGAILGTACATSAR